MSTYCLNYIETNFGQTNINFYEVITAMLNSQDEELVTYARLYKTDFNVLKFLSDNLVIKSEQYRLYTSGNNYRYFGPSEFDQLSSIYNTELEVLKQQLSLTVKLIGLRLVIENSDELNFILSIKEEANQQHEMLKVQAPNLPPLPDLETELWESFNLNSIDDLPPNCKVKIITIINQTGTITDRENFEQTLQQEQDNVDNYFKSQFRCERRLTDQTNFFDVWLPVLYNDPVADYENDWPLPPTINTFNITEINNQ
jgi:hypothetical protein